MKFLRMNKEEMPFLDHLEELRWRLVWCLAALTIGNPGLPIAEDMKRRELIQYLRRLRRPGIVYCSTTIAVDQIHAQGMEAHVWTVNAGQDMRRAIEPTEDQPEAAGLPLETGP
mgnify:CR=1 FL=1